MNFKDLNLLDIGNSLELSGIVYSRGNTEEIVIFLPNYEHNEEEPEPRFMYPTLEEWNQIIRQSDLLETEIVGEDKNKKIILRKSTRQIDLNVSWEVFRRDKYKCRYCGNDHVPLTVDHIVLWEEGGPSIEINLITSCKKCNNLRGNMPYDVWLKSPEYKRVSQHLTEKEQLENEVYANRIPIIRTDHMRVNKRNR